MGEVYGIQLTVIDTKVILKTVKKKEKEFIIIIENLLKVIDMKAIIKIINKMEKELFISVMVIDMKAI